MTPLIALRVSGPLTVEGLALATGLHPDAARDALHGLRAKGLAEGRGFAGARPTVHARLYDLTDAGKAAFDREMAGRAMEVAR